MAYQVLARKWRPKNFAQLVGQTHVQKALLNALETQQLHHAYLFTGTRGVGKTTIARILARCLNCEQGVTTTPCGECSSCCEINEGRFPDLIEVDAASRTKVEDTRELLENVQYAPVRGRYKVYLIDEVHMLSTHSFNALLKTLEEPPPHVKFLLATTDPQKLPATILSRCLQFHLKNMSPEYIVSHLQHVLSQEQIEFDDEALWQLANAAQGSMRDAMSLTDQAIAFGGGCVQQADVRDMLGTIDRASAWEVIECLHRDDREALFHHIDVLAQHSVDFSGLLDELIHCLHIVMREQMHPLPNKTGPDAAACQRVVEMTNIEQIQLFYQIALNGKKDIDFAPSARVGFEVVLLRLLAFKPLTLDQQLHAAVEPEGVGVKKPKADGGETQPASGLTRTVPTAQVSPRPVEEPPAHILEDTYPVVAKELVSGTVQQSSDAGGRSRVAIPPASLAETMLVSEDVSGQHKPVGSVHEDKQAKAPYSVALPQANTVSDVWLQLFDQLHLEAMVKSIASNCELTAVDDAGHWILHMASSMQAVYDDRYRVLLQTSLIEQVNEFDAQFTLTIVPSDSVSHTPALYAKAQAQRRHEQALQSLQNDPNIQYLQEHFGGILRPDTVRLLSPESN